MRTLEQIQKEINALQDEFNQVKLKQLYTLFCEGDSDERIGFFDIGNTRKILAALHLGITLQYRHPVHNAVNVWMNPQRNRICVSEHNHIKESNILDHILWNYGTWYRIND